MKKLALVAIVAAFAATVIGCGPAPTTAKPTTGSTEVKSSTEKK